MTTTKQLEVNYHKDDIAIVGYGCVLPDAPSPDLFWKNILNGHCSIKPLPDSRFDRAVYVGKRGAEDKTYTNHAASVSDDITKEIMQRHGLSGCTRLEAFALEAAHQACQGISLPKDSCTILGCMTQDEAISLQELRREENSLKAHLKNSQVGEKACEVVSKTLEAAATNAPDHKRVFFPTSSIDRIRTKFGLEGEGFLIDAACASSLAAINAAMQKLRSGECKAAITGGIEANLSPETFNLFACVDLLSETKCLPLDNSTDGLSQGEGAVVFILQRVESALEEGLEIHSIIRSCEGANNGRSSSMFSPTVKGQLDALKRARTGLPFSHIDYFECHATGTRVGDVTELATIEEHFDFAVDVGGVKALIGHTKGAAGAAGLLKSLLALKHRTLPPERHFSRFIEGYSGKNARVNTSAKKLEKRELPLIFGVNSAGFGGINYHATLEEFKKDHTITEKRAFSNGDIVVAASTRLPYDKTRELFESYDFKIPPSSLSKIDRLQLLALCTTRDAFSKLGINESDLPKESVSVIAACFSGNDAASDLTWRIRHGEFKRFTDDKTVVSAIEGHKNKYPKLGEDTGPGVLNSVIAGRVSNLFGFSGKSFALDADMNSMASGLSFARTELRSGDSKFVILLSREFEVVKKPITTAKTLALRCHLLCLERTAVEYWLETEAKIDNLSFSNDETNG